MSLSCSILLQHYFPYVNKTSVNRNLNWTELKSTQLRKRMRRNKGHRERTGEGVCVEGGCCGVMQEYQCSAGHVHMGLLDGKGTFLWLLEPWTGPSVCGWNDPVHAHPGGNNVDPPTPTPHSQSLPRCQSQLCWLLMLCLFLQGDWAGSCSGEHWQKKRSNSNK